MMVLVVLADKFGLRLAATEEVVLVGLALDFVVDGEFEPAADRAAFFAGRLVLDLAKLEPFALAVFWVTLVFRDAGDFFESVAEDASGVKMFPVEAVSDMAGGSAARAARLAAFLVFFSPLLTADRSAR